MRSCGVTFENSEILTFLRGPKGEGGGVPQNFKMDRAALYRTKQDHRELYRTMTNDKRLYSTKVTGLYMTIQDDRG